MRAEIIATGSELLTGGVVETNSLFLAGELMDIGIETAFKTVVADNDRDMDAVFRQALERAEVVIITGGLGPTEDDITRRVLAQVLKKRLLLNEEALRSVQAVFASRGREYPGANDRQALIPVGARILPNPVGVAPGFFLIEENKFIAVLPGVPAEMVAMFRENLRRELEVHCGGSLFIRRKVLHTSGLSESKVNELLGSLLKQKQPVVGLSARDTGVDVRVIVKESDRARALVSLERIEAEIRKQLADAVYGVDGQEMEEVVGELLKQRRLTLAVAESCTGGLIGARITNVAGSSDYFDRGVVVYSNSSKTALIGVPAELIEQQGAVSRQVAAAMAAGIRQNAGADLGLSVTGIAGPGGGSPEKPVGLAYIGLATASGVKVDELRFLGDRNQVRQRTAQAALDRVRRHLIA